MFDVHIVGAGPSGCIAAISAVHAGHNVLVSEEDATAGGKPCSGLFSRSGLETLRKHFDWSGAVEKEICGADIHLGESLISIRKKSPIAYACDRRLFDRLLADAAEREGAKIEYGKRITNEFKARRVIGADGANSTVASFFRFLRLKRFVGTLQGEVGAGWDEDVVQLFVSSDFPGFFGWAIPRGAGRFEIGCGAELPRNAGDAFRKLKARLGVKAVENIRGSIIPLKARALTAKSTHHHDVYLVGDAAGQTKATTGGGVMFGAWCAEIAGATSSPLHYEISWRAKYGKELLFHRLARRMLNRLDDRRLTLLGRELAAEGFEDFLEQHGDMDKISGMLVKTLFNPKIPLIFLKSNI